MNQRNQVISRYLKLIQLSLCQIKPKTYRLYMPNFVEKVKFDTFLSVANPLLHTPLK